MARAKKADQVVDSKQGAPSEIVNVKTTAKEAVNKEKKEAKSVAKARVRAIIAEMEAGVFKTDLMLIVGSGNRGGGGRQVSTAKTAIVEMIQSHGVVTEDEIWNDYKLGRAEMRKITVSLIKKVTNPADRIWISFDPEAGEYRLVAEGADVPKGWTGYRPVDTEDIDL